MTDSVVSDRLVNVKGDTVRIEITRDHWRTRIEHDTVRIEKSDTIPAPYPVEKRVEVERKCRWWETALMWGGGIMAFSVIVLFLFCYFRKVTNHLISK